MVTLSVIVPVYNSVNKGLRSCLESIVAQTFSDYELILVNDGSTDASLDLCREFQSRDNRIKVIDKQNQGVSAARNDGIKIAEGELVTFIDSDDFVEPRYFEELIKASHNTNLVVCGIVQHFQDKEDKIYSAPEGNYMLNDADAFHSLIKSRLMFGPCNKLFRTSVIKDFDLCFPEDINYGEDRLFCYDYLTHISEFVAINSTHYDYLVQNSESLSTIKRCNLFDLEYTQWQRLLCLYKHHRVLTTEAEKDLHTELYWMISDAISSESYDGSISRERIKRILSVQEITTIRKYADSITTNPLFKLTILSKSVLGVMLCIKILNTCRK